MATRGSLGGLAEAALQAALLMDASGKDDVLLETVGVGQGEIDIVDHADTIVLALMPGSGDSIQALKAGVMEIPDVIVVNKADHPLADTMIREVRSALGLGPQGDWKVPVVRTEALKGEGIAELLGRSTPTARTSTETGSLAERRARNLAPRCWASPRRGFAGSSTSAPPSDPEWEDCSRASSRRETDPASAAAEAARDGRRWLTTLPHRPRAPHRTGPDLDEARSWIGGRLDEIGGTSVAKVEGVFVDSETGRPEWLAVRRRPLRAARTCPAPRGGGRRRSRVGRPTRATPSRALRASARRPR